MTDDERAELLKRDLEAIPEQIRIETSRSRYRDHGTRRRVHPLDHDLGALIEFAVDRRRREGPAVCDAARRVMTMVDTDALRFLIRVVLEHGQCNITVKRRCARLLAHCENLDAALALHVEWRRAHPMIN